MFLQIPMDKKECDMKDLIPENPNLVGRKNVRRKNPKNAKSRRPKNPRKKPMDLDESTGVPDLLSYGGDIDPFKDSFRFVGYYRAFLRSSLAKKPRFANDEKLKFASFESDVVFAGIILDLLHESKSKNKAFLDTWITDYFENKLSGKKIRHVDKTSMRAFKDSFAEFKLRYMVAN